MGRLLHVVSYVEVSHPLEILHRGVMINQVLRRWRLQSSWHDRYVPSSLSCNMNIYIGADMVISTFGRQISLNASSS